MYRGQCGAVDLCEAIAVTDPVDRLRAADADPVRSLRRHTD